MRYDDKTRKIINSDWSWFLVFVIGIVLTKLFNWIGFFITLVLLFLRYYTLNLLDKKYAKHDTKNFKEYKKEIVLSKIKTKKDKEIFRIQNKDFIENDVDLEIEKGIFVDNSKATMIITPDRYSESFLDENALKGEYFENYILSLLKKDDKDNRFEFLWITPSIMRFKEKKMWLSLKENPDFKIISKSNKKYWIECKYRTNWDNWKTKKEEDNGVFRLDNDEIIKYSKYENLWIVLGINTKEKNTNHILKPEKLYLFPFRILKNHPTFIEDERYEINVNDADKIIEEKLN